MEKRATIKDIAEQAGVSAGTVHRALYGKPGVGDEVRARVLKIANTSGYRPNYVASALKRKTLRVLAAFPVPTERNRYFYTHIWQGLRDYVKEIHDYNLEIIELPYRNEPNGQSEELEAAWRRYEGGIDGLITLGRADEQGSRVIGRYVDAGVPVVLACDDLKDSGRLCCVQANYDVTGRMASELLYSQLSSGDKVLLCAGDVIVPSHYKTVEGFDAYLAEHPHKIEAFKLYGYANEDEVRLRMSELLQNDPKIAAVFGVTARGSVLAASLLRELNLTERVRLIASDLFSENIKNMRDGVAHNILFKNPYRQSFLAAKILSDYLIKGEKPPQETRYVDSIMIFRSNLSMYDH